MTHTNPEVKIRYTCSHTVHMILYLILQVPYTIPMSEFFKCCAALGQNAAFKATHVEQKIWIVFAVDRHKAFIPAQCCDRSRQAVLNVPEHSTAKIDIMLH